MGVCAFSEYGKYFSLISPDGRLKIWDTETNVLKQEYTPDFHLSSPPTCLQWLSLGGGSTKRKRKSSQVDSANLNDVKNSYLALGTATGKILLYSVEQAKIESVLSDEKDGKAVSCLDWSQDRGLFSCSSESVFEWNIRNGDVKQKYRLKTDEKKSFHEKITTIKIIPNSQVLGSADSFILLGCCRIILYNLSAQRVAKEFIGHSTDVSHLSMVNFSKSGKCFAISACVNERIISLWNLSNCQDEISSGKSPKKRPKTKSYCNFLMEDTPRDLSCFTEDGDATSLVVTAITRTGSLHYYKHILNGTSNTKAIKPTVTVQLVTEDARPLPVLSSYLLDDHRNNALCIAYLSSLISQKVSFEKITPDLSSKCQVIVRQGSDASKKSKSKKDPGDASKVRSTGDDATDRDRIVYLDGGGGTKSSLKRNVVGKQIEVPMQSRLANLSLETGAEPSTKQNMGQLLVQGLHSNDKKLLLTVLQCTDPEVAFNSVSRLPPRYLNPLLVHLTDMFTGKTSQAKAARVWLSATLRAHSSLLLATASSSPTAEQIVALLSALATKRSTLGSLLALRGRLTLTLGQMERLSSDETNEEDHALLEYRESSDEESIDQDALGPVVRATSDDENSWDEDDDARNRRPESQQSDSEMDEDE